MEKILLQPVLKKENMENVIRQYHFRTSDYETLYSLYQALQPLLRAQGYYVWQPEELKTGLACYAAVFLTLGDGPDRLQELYLRQSCVSEAYMLDCICSELLSVAYKDFAGQMQKRTGYLAVQLHFIGDRYPFSMIDQMAALMDQTVITYNSQYVMTPKNSVAFLIEMKECEKHAAEHQRVQLKHLCADCSNKDCAYRKNENFSYGYQRIFGKNGGADQ